MYGPWKVTTAGDQACRQLADRHYSRQTIGHPQFCRPGRKLVLRTPDGNAVWVTWKGIRKDGLDALECTIFRNESEYLSSEMIKEALIATVAEWGALPRDGLITYVNEAKIKSDNPGCCFKIAGFKAIGRSKERNLLLLQYRNEVK